jgi:hypothetical protein
MVNGLAATEPVILNEFKTGCPSAFRCAVAAFWTATRRSRSSSGRRSNKFRAPIRFGITKRWPGATTPPWHGDEPVLILEYLRCVLFAAHQPGKGILRIVFAIDAGISPGRRELPLREFVARLTEQLAQTVVCSVRKYAHGARGAKFQIHDRGCSGH